MFPLCDSDDTEDTMATTVEPEGTPHWLRCKYGDELSLYY